MLIGCYWSHDMNALHSLDVISEQRNFGALQNTCMSRAMYKASPLGKNKN